MLVIGRTSREEEATKGSGEEENGVHTTICQRDNDWWQEKGALILMMSKEIETDSAFR